MLLVFNLIVVACVLGLAYLWMTRGFFSAFLHLLCTLAAGAIAFAFWEPLSELLVSVLPTSGWLRFLHGMSWGIGLLVPFVVSLVLLRVIVDKLVIANVAQATAVDYAGGVICGGASSVIAVGFLVLSVGYFRLSTNFLGYQPIWYSDDRDGSLVRKDKLWLPVDSIVANLYGTMSENALSTSEPLTKWRPNIELTGFAARISPGDGAGRNTFNNDDFRLVRAYTVGSESAPARDLLTDTFDETPQKYRDISGEPVSTGQLFGYVIEFKAGAKEDSKGAQVLMSNGQIFMIAEKTDENAEGDRSTVIFPIASISQAEAKEGNLYGRWRYDAEDIYIASVGGASAVKMAFEFIVPAGYHPIALSVKNARLPLTDLPQATEPIRYDEPSDRDAAITSGALIKGSAEISFDESDAVIVPDSDVKVSFARTLTPPGVYISNRLGYSLDRTTAKRGLVVEEDGKSNAIFGGEGSFSEEESKAGRNAERNFRVERFGVASDQNMVQIGVSGEDMPASLLSPVVRALDADLPPRLVDTNGAYYEAIGWVYEDSEGVWIRYTPSKTIASLRELPKSLSRARTDQKLRLLFVVSRGAKISHYVLGDKAILKFEAPFECDQRQGG